MNNIKYPTKIKSKLSKLIIRQQFSISYHVGIKSKKYIRRNNYIDTLKYTKTYLSSDINNEQSKQITNQPNILGKILGITTFGCYYLCCIFIFVDNINISEYQTYYLIS